MMKAFIVPMFHFKTLAIVRMGGMMDDASKIRAKEEKGLK